MSRGAGVCEDSSRGWAVGTEKVVVRDEAGRLVAGRYRLQHPVGDGGMGVVWCAVDERLDRVVAVKQLRLPPGLGAGQAEQARQRVLREARIAGRLQHPNAVGVLDVADDAGQPVLVMEYVPSRSLADVLAERGALQPREVAGIGAAVASALAAAHAAGVVHRDVKPGNAFQNKLVGAADVGTVGFRHLRCWLAWLATVCFGCGVAPTWPRRASKITSFS